MWGKADFFIGFILPILLMGVAIGWVLFWLLPLAWRVLIG